MPFWDRRVEGRTGIGHAPWEDYQPDRAEHGAWYHFDEPPLLDDGTLDPLALIVFADTMPGSIGEKVGRRTTGWFAPSVDLTFHLLDTCRGEWVFAHGRARFAGDGYASVDMALWDFGPAGTDPGGSSPTRPSCACSPSTPSDAVNPSDRSPIAVHCGRVGAGDARHRRHGGSTTCRPNSGVDADRRGPATIAVGRSGRLGGDRPADAGDAADALVALDPLVESRVLGSEMVQFGVGGSQPTSSASLFRTARTITPAMSPRRTRSPTTRAAVELCWQVVAAGSEGRAQGR